MSKYRRSFISKRQSRSFLVFAILSIYALNMAVLGVSIGPETYFGHSFDEEYWSIDYNFFNSRVVKDYTPGKYANSYNPPQDRRYEYGETNAFITYLQVGNSRTLFLGSQNHSMNTQDPAVGGFSPYQTLIQTYPSNSGEYVIVQNTFVGLIAHWPDQLENLSNENTSEHYFGSTINANAIKNILNYSLSQKLGYSALKNTQTSIQSNPIEKLEIQKDNMNYTEYRFGINYSNVWIFWQSVKATQGLNRTLTESDILTEIIGFSNLEYINFTYIVQEKKISSRISQIFTSIEYDIGSTSDLWLKNDNSTLTASFNGTFVNMGLGRSISRYNSSESIAARFSLNNTKNFSLNVANYVRTATISAKTHTSEFRNLDDEEKEIQTEDQRSLNKMNIKSMKTRELIYKIDFTAKPNYTINGLELPVRFSTFPSSNIVNPDISAIDRTVTSFIQPYIKAAIENHFRKQRIGFRNLRTNINIESIQSFYYFVNFPLWNGYAISQDPVLIAYPSPFDLDQGFLLVIILGLIIGLCALPSILVKKYKK